MQNVFPFASGVKRLKQVGAIPSCAPRRPGSHWLIERNRMQRVITAITWIALLVLPDLASAKPDGVPRFDVARSCQEARAYTGDDKNLTYRSCMKDENDARADLARKWAKFNPGDRKDCVAQGAAPVPSYVELLTCLEMSEEAEALYKPDGTLRDKRQGSAVPGRRGQDQAAPSGAAPAPESGGVKKPD
jgi:hypothetical protein